MAEHPPEGGAIHATAAGELAVDAEVSVHSIRGVDSMVSLRQELPGSGRPGDIEPVVLVP